MYPIATVHKELFKIDFFNFEIYVTDKKYFNAKFPDIMPSLLSLKTRADCLRLMRNPLTFYQNQFNMAVWFATTGCGISVNDHLNHPSPMIRSLYRFHTYFQMLKVFSMLQIPLPGDPAFNEINNNINRQKLKEVLSDFGLNDEYNFSTFYGWDSWSVPDYNPNIVDPYYYISDNKINMFLCQVYTDKTPPMFKADWEANINNFRHKEQFIKYHVNQHKNVFEVINQKPQQTYQQFMTLKSKDLTKTGIAWLNDSIRTYVYCILGSQAETRTPIIDSYGTELDAQKEFKKLVFDSYHQHVDIPTSIERYQKAIADTHVRLDYVVATGLYIISSDMILKVGNIDNYNNNILIATKTMKPGKNDINSLVYKSPPLMQGESVKTVSLKTNITALTAKDVAPSPKATHKSTIHDVPLGAKTQEDANHENVKYILLVGIGAAVGLVLYYVK